MVENPAGNGPLVLTSWEFDSLTYGFTTDDELNCPGAANFSVVDTDTPHNFPSPIAIGDGATMGVALSNSISMNASAPMGCRQKHLHRRYEDQRLHTVVPAPRQRRDGATAGRPSPSTERSTT